MHLSLRRLLEISTLEADLLDLTLSFPRAVHRLIDNFMLSFIGDTAGAETVNFISAPFSLNPWNLSFGILRRMVDLSSVKLPD